MSTSETPTNGLDAVIKDESNAVTVGIVSLALALTAVMGGGTLATSFQYWSFRIMAEGTPDPGWLAQSASALPSIVLALMAIGLGVVAARSTHSMASAFGKAGVALGILALFGGIVLALSLHDNLAFS